LSVGSRNTVRPEAASLPAILVSAAKSGSVSGETSAAMRSSRTLTPTTVELIPAGAEESETALRVTSDGCRRV
jgi:hypothetical protein